MSTDFKRNSIINSSVINNSITQHYNKLIQGNKLKQDVLLRSLMSFMTAALD